MLTRIILSGQIAAKGRLLEVLNELESELRSDSFSKYI
jgi:hypothetical protein